MCICWVEVQISEKQPNCFSVPLTHTLMLVRLCKKEYPTCTMYWKVNIRGKSQWRGSDFSSLKHHVWQQTNITGWKSALRFEVAPKKSHPLPNGSLAQHSKKWLSKYNKEMLTSSKPLNFWKNSRVFFFFLTGPSTVQTNQALSSIKSLHTTSLFLPRWPKCLASVRKRKKKQFYRLWHHD